MFYTVHKKQPLFVDPLYLIQKPCITNMKYLSQLIIATTAGIFNHIYSYFFNTKLEYQNTSDLDQLIFIL